MSNVVGPDASQYFTLHRRLAAGHHLGGHRHLHRRHAGTFTVTATGPRPRPSARRGPCHRSNLLYDVTGVLLRPAPRPSRPRLPHHRHRVQRQPAERHSELHPHGERARLFVVVTASLPWDDLSEPPTSANAVGDRGAKDRTPGRSHLRGRCRTGLSLDDCHWGRHRENEHHGRHLLNDFTVTLTDSASDTATKAFSWIVGLLPRPCRPRNSAVRWWALPPPLDGNGYWQVRSGGRRRRCTAPPTTTVRRPATTSTPRSSRSSVPIDGQGYWLVVCRRWGLRLRRRWAFDGSLGGQTPECCRWWGSPAAVDGQGLLAGGGRRWGLRLR